VNKDGIPDCNQDHVCIYEEREMPSVMLKATSDAQYTEIEFDTPVHYPKFTIFSIDEKEGKYSDACSIIYTDKDGKVSEPITRSAGNIANSEEECADAVNWNVEIDEKDIKKIQIILENKAEVMEGEEFSESMILFDKIEVCS